MNSSPAQSKSQQSMDSLRLANEIRTRRATMKRRLRDCANRGESLTLLAKWIEEEHPAIQSERVSRLLLSCRKCGPTFCRNFLMSVRMGEYTEVQHLSDSRREKIVTLLRR